MQTYFIFRLRDNEVIQAKSLELHILFCFVLFCFFAGSTAIAGSRMGLCPHIHQGRREYPIGVILHQSGIHLIILSAQS